MTAVSPVEIQELARCSVELAQKSRNEIAELRTGINRAEAHLDAMFGWFDAISYRPNLHRHDSN